MKHTDQGHTWRQLGFVSRRFLNLRDWCYIGFLAEADVTHWKWNFTSVATCEKSVNGPLNSALYTRHTFCFHFGYMKPTHTTYSHTDAGTLKWTYLHSGGLPHAAGSARSFVLPWQSGRPQKINIRLSLHLSQCLRLCLHLSLYLRKWPSLWLALLYSLLRHSSSSHYINNYLEGNNHP